MQKQNCCGTTSGVCFLATNMGPAHGDMLLWMIPASSKFSISCLKKSWCLRSKGYGQAAIGEAFSLVAICILMRSVQPILLSLFDIIVAYFCSRLHNANFVSFKIFVSLSSTCLWNCTLPGIKTEVFGTGL